MMHNKKQQYGRSMIEMLGVLAIIGVLSVGGLAGYNKAMAKYKINKALNQVMSIATGIKTLYASKNGNYTSCGDVSLLLQAKIVSADMLIEDKPSISQDDFDNFINTCDTSSLCDAISAAGYGNTAVDSYDPATIECWMWQAADCSYGNSSSEYAEHFRKYKNLVFSPKYAIKNPFGGTLAIAGAQDSYAIAMDKVPQNACIEIGSLGLNVMDGFGTVAINNTQVTGNNVSQATTRCSANKNTITFYFQ